MNLGNYCKIAENSWKRHTYFKIVVKNINYVVIDT
jgi:hypothetical protein